MPNSSSRSRRSWQLATTPASTRATSTALPPTATIAAMRRGWPQRSGHAGCAPSRCGGAEAAGLLRGGRQWRGVHRGRPRRLRGRVPFAGAGPIRQVRAGRGPQYDFGRESPPDALRRARAAAAFRHAGEALHAQTRCTSGCLARDRAGVRSRPKTVTVPTSHWLPAKADAGCAPSRHLGVRLDRRLVALQRHGLVAGGDQFIEDARGELELIAAERGEFDVVDLGLVGRELAQQRLALLGDRQRNPPPVDAVLGLFDEPW
jgi:hypothetical protein